MSWGVGPLALYVAKLKNPGVVRRLRWVNEFEVTNLSKGNTPMLSVTLKFN
jgi:hypothetical protein